MLLREAVDFQCRAPSVHTAKVSLFTVPRVFWLAAFWGCLALVTVFALTPVTVPLPSTPWDKANHALAFAVLYALAGQCWPGKGRPVFLALLAYGGAIEVAQSFTETRHGEWLDLLADGIGLALGHVFVLLRARK